MWSLGQKLECRFHPNFWHCHRPSRATHRMAGLCDDRGSWIMIGKGGGPKGDQGVDEGE